jgi:hypothetical protein
MQNSPRVEEAKHGELTPELLARFWSKVDTTGGDNACWLWTGAIKPGTKYGCFRTGSKIVEYAHRVSLRIALGDAPSAVAVAMHSCDNPPCCNPKHLSWGTHADNVRDMFEKGRAPGGISSADVVDMLRLVQGGMTNGQAAAKYGVSARLVSRIRNGKTWRKIAEPCPGRRGRPRKAVAA